MLYIAPVKLGCVYAGNKLYVAHSVIVWISSLLHSVEHVSHGNPPHAKFKFGNKHMTDGNMA